MNAIAILKCRAFAAMKRPLRRILRVAAMVIVGVAVVVVGNLLTATLFPSLFP